ncbi:hypothetical protein [Nonomuraea sp. NPDC050783]|uniref:hypothetical protein n=1 Tax=Nonomuraea sp. NPDC050783 TaxID=3154634 RepID=UPI0034665A7C
MTTIRSTVAAALERVALVRDALDGLTAEPAGHRFRPMVAGTPRVSGEAGSAARLRIHVAGKS